MKKILCKISILIIMLMLMTYSAFALSSYNDETSLIDQAGVLTDDEEIKLEEMIGQFTLTNKLDLAIILIDDESFTSPKNDAENFYNDTKMGYGDTENGLLFYINFATRDFYMIAKNLGKDIYPNYDIDNITSAISGDLSSGNYYDALKSYINLCDGYAKAYYKNINKSDSNIDSSNHSQDTNVYDNYDYTDNSNTNISWKTEAIIFGIGLLISLLVILGLRASMNTAKSATYAGNYIIPGSFKLYRESDKYLYSRTSRTAKPKENSSSSSGSGGGSSSSGFSGGGGKF